MTDTERVEHFLYHLLKARATLDMINDEDIQMQFVAERESLDDFIKDTMMYLKED